MTIFRRRTAAAVAPANTAAATLGGADYETGTITASGETWDVTPDTIAYQWQISDFASSWADISGATSASYVPVTDAMRYVRRRSVATKAGLSSSPAYSNNIRVKLNVGAQLAMYGDGTFAENACPGLRCASLWTTIYLNGRVMTSPAWMQCFSGGDMDTIYARRAVAIGNQADIAGFASEGHNDVLLGTDPDTDATQINKWYRNLDAWIAGNTTARLIPVCTTIKSTVSSEATTASVGGMTRAQRVNQLQLAYIATKAAADPRIVAVDTFALYDAVNMSQDSGSNNTHPDMRGGYALGFDTGGVGPTISPYLRSQTKDQILEMLRANTYPGLTGTNFDTDVLLQGGTGGTKSGTVAPTGNYPTGKRITNNLTNGTSVAVTCSIDSSAGSYSDAVVAVSGTPAAEGTIVQDDTGSISCTGSTPGQYGVAIWGVTIDDGAGGAPVGFRGINAAYGNFGQIGSALSDSTTLTLTHAIDTVIIAAPRVFFSSSGPFSANPALTTRWAATALTGRIRISRPTLHVINTRTRSAPAGVYDGVLAAGSYAPRPSGTISQAAGGTLRVEPGMVAPYGLTEADIVTRRFYKGTVSDTTASVAGVGGAGTKIGSDMTGSTWTQLYGAGAVTTGDKIFSEIDINNGVGSTVTIRSSAASVVTAT